MRVGGGIVVEPASRQLMLQLKSILADLYPTNELALELAEQTGLKKARISQSSRPETTWWNIIVEADRQLMLPVLIELARAEYPRHEGLRLAALGQLADVSGPEVHWVDPLPHEVVTGRDDLLPVAFLEVGAEIAKSVVRIAIGDGGYGSGFLIAQDLVLTNHHVLPSIDVARDATVELGCQETLAGVSILGVPHKTRADNRYLANQEHDWAVVQIEPIATCTPISLAAITRARMNERVFIIQHPGGGPKQVALGDNRVTHVDDNRIQYLTDTRPGSSGSPVFDRQWRLVGIHHSGGWLSQPGSKAMQFRNEGIAIGIVRDALVKAELVKL